MCRKVSFVICNIYHLQVKINIYCEIYNLVICLGIYQWKVAFYLDKTYLVETIACFTLYIYIFIVYMYIQNRVFHVSKRTF